MTAKAKALIKAFFETGDKPSQAQFIDLIDSYVDSAGPLGALEAAASAGAVGFAFVSGLKTEVLSGANSLSFLGATVVTTAQASAATQNVINSLVATTAQAVAGTSNTTLMTPVLTKNVAAGAAGYIAPGFATNRYYIGASMGIAVGDTAAMTADRLYVVPFTIGAGATFTRIGINVTVLSAGNARLGIYNAANGIPTTLVLDAGTVSTGTTGEKEITISQTLTAGAYVLAVVFSGTPTIYVTEANVPIMSGDFWGYADSNNASGVPHHAYTAFAYAALPSPWSGALTYSYQNGATPFIWMRVV